MTKTEERNLNEVIKCSVKIADGVERALAFSALADALRGENPEPALEKVRQAERRHTTDALRGPLSGRGQSLEQAAYLAAAAETAAHFSRGRA